MPKATFTPLADKSRISAMLMSEVDATIALVTPGVGRKHTTHAADEAAPARGVDFPAGQGVHSEAPEAEEYVPTGHSVGLTDDSGQ